jgi:hypothetical protein
LVSLPVPSDIKSYLAKNERIVKTEKSAEWEIYVTKKRAIFKKQGILGKEIVEASYHHISSIEYKKKSRIAYIILGIVVLTVLSLEGILVQDQFISLLFFLMGLLFVISIVLLAYLEKPKYTIHILGRKPIEVSAKLEGIIKTIREYQASARVGLRG